MADTQVEELSALQRLLYGVIQHVMSGVNPQGYRVFSFTHPSAMELDHDFLWRTTQSLLERGRIGIFNRSYYEEVLIVAALPTGAHRANATREGTVDRKKPHGSGSAYVIPRNSAA